MNNKIIFLKRNIVNILKLYLNTQISIKLTITVYMCKLKQNKKTIFKAFQNKNK